MPSVSNNNYEQLVNSQGLGATTVICDINKGTGSATEAELVAVLKAIANAGFTVAGFYAGTLGTDPAYVALQGTGTVNTAGGAYGTDITVGGATNITFA